MLAEELNLPGTNRVMLYPHCSDITDADLEEARSEIARNETRPKFIHFLAKWEPWQEAIKRMHPEDYALVDEERQEKMYALLYERPATLSDGDYMLETKRIKSIMPKWFEQRTDEFLLANPTAAQPIQADNDATR